MTATLKDEVEASARVNFGSLRRRQSSPHLEEMSVSNSLPWNSFFAAEPPQPIRCVTGSEGRLKLKTMAAKSNRSRFFEAKRYIVPTSNELYYSLRLCQAGNSARLSRFLAHGLCYAASNLCVRKESVQALRYKELRGLHSGSVVIKK